MLSLFSRSCAERAEPCLAERRAVERLPLSLELRYSFVKGGITYQGSGRTRDIGQSFIRFEHDTSLPANTQLELRIAWPAQLGNVCALELVVRGSLVRKDRGGALLRSTSYEFQTCGATSFYPTIGWGNACNVVG